MNLQEEVLKIVKNDVWLTGRTIAEQIALKFPEEFKTKYGADISLFTRALGSVLNSLRNQKRIFDDGTPYPGTKKWKKVESELEVKSERGECITVEDVARALVKLGLANDEAQGVRMLASRTVREHSSEYESLTEKANKISDEASKIGRQMLGLE